MRRHVLEADAVGRAGSHVKAEDSLVERGAYRGIQRRDFDVGDLAVLSERVVGHVRYLTPATLTFGLSLYRKEEPAVGTMVLARDPEPQGG
jgi:hypothetical protein